MENNTTVASKVVVDLGNLSDSLNKTVSAVPVGRSVVELLAPQEDNTGKINHPFCRMMEKSGDTLVPRVGRKNAQTGKFEGSYITLSFGVKNADGTLGAFTKKTFNIVDEAAYRQTYAEKVVGLSSFRKFCAQMVHGSAKASGQLSPSEQDAVNAFVQRILSGDTSLFGSRYAVDVEQNGNYRNITAIAPEVIGLGAILPTANM